MDSQINAAALALAAGDPLAALQRVSLRGDAPALALRGIAMAQLGELARAAELLRQAARAFGVREPRARARCLLAGAEVALAARDFRGCRSLDRALPALEAQGDRVNVLHARCLEVRRALLLEAVEALLASPALIVDACRRVVRCEDVTVSLRRRPILEIEPQTGEVVATIPAPGQGRDSGLAWAEGTLWVGEYRSRKIHQVNPETLTLPSVGIEGGF